MRGLVLAAAGAASALWAPPAADAASPFLTVPAAEVAEATPAYRYANMGDAEAFAELDRRGVIYSRLGPVHGVRAPVRLTGRLHGVWFHSSLSAEERQASPFEILDARLALTLDDFAAILERHDIDEVVHFTMYRPDVGGSDGVHDHDEQEAPRIAKEKERSRGVGQRRRPAAKDAEGGDEDDKATGKRSGKARSAKGDPPELSKGTPLKARGDKPRGSKLKGAPSTEVRSPDGASTGARSPGGASTGARSPGGASKSRAAGKGKGDKDKDKPVKGESAKSSRARTMARLAEMSPRAKSSPAAPGTRHPAGLAIDVGGLRKKDGRWISVGYHFQGKIGDQTCGAGARIPESPEARELRSIVCEAADLGIFTYTLTPNYNLAHADHFHMEIKPGVRWFLYH
ncbi:MAG: extensin family protein [Polyangiaceae bacterium]